MSINQLLFLFLFFYLYAIHFCNDSLNVRSKHNIIKNITNIRKKFRKKNQKKNFTTRKLDDDEEYEFNDLKIFIDYAEFEANFPSQLSDIKGRFKTALENAKSTLQNILQIQVVSDGSTVILNDHDGIREKTVETEYGITEHSEIFNENYLYFNESNYFLFVKFTELNQESASLILDKNPFELSAPAFGIILFNNKREYLDSLDKSKLTQTYLNNLMLHHFIRLMGFDEYYVDEDYYIPQEGVVIYLDEENELNSFTNTLDYAREYFGCSEIDKINLYIDTENTDIYASKQTNRLYWPETLFSGEILTKFDYSEEPVLSGFTLAFLSDLPYLKVKIANAGDLTRFGKYAGCSSKCENFYTDVNHFWDCSVCREGYFRAIESSESETICENNNNKDYYFLFNAESQIYKKCESAIANCQKCSSQTKCTLCKRGYELDDENGSVICEKEDDGLSTGAIIGIVFGCIGFLAIVALIIICLLKRRNKENEGEIEQKDEDVNEKKDEETEPKNVQDLKEGNVKIMEYSKNSEIIDSGAEVKKDNA